MEKANVWNQMIEVLKTDVVPATGCTEPISLAFAAANAAKYIGEPIEKVHGRVSANLMKNGMAVMVPGTGLPGLSIAAAVGALGGDPDGGLQVLKQLTPNNVELAKEMVDAGHVTVDVNHDTDHVLYAEATVYSANHNVKVIIVDHHTNIIAIEKDGQSIFEQEMVQHATDAEKLDFLHSLSVKDIVEFAEQVPLKDIQFIKDAEILNNHLSEAGLSGNYGMEVGKSLKKAMDSHILSNDLQQQVIMRTVAASDARMGGAPLPAMTNSGSGNQGIAATTPVTVVADHVQANEETRIRALALSNMMAVYAHSYLPKLSAFCATVTAAMGAAAGMVWLLDREDALAKISHALSSMTGDISGMICDGAASSCAMKVATATTSAFRAVLLALHDVRVPGTDGIVAYNIEESIKNIGLLATQGMQETDREVLEIMLHKNQAQ